MNRQLFNRAACLLDDEWRHSWHWGKRENKWQIDAIETARDAIGIEPGNDDAIVRLIDDLKADARSDEETAAWSKAQDESGEELMGK